MTNVPQVENTPLESKVVPNHIIISRLKIKIWTTHEIFLALQRGSLWGILTPFGVDFGLVTLLKFDLHKTF